MKLFKKVSAMMVSLLMALAMMVPVAAADATVTIKNKGDNEELKYIQVIVPDRETKTGWKFADTTIAEEFTKVFGKSEQEILKEMTTDNAVASKVRTALKGVQVAKANDLTKTDATVNFIFMEIVLQLQQQEHMLFLVLIRLMK